MYEKYHSVFKASGLVENIDIPSFDRALQKAKPTFKTFNSKDCVICDGSECKDITLILSGSIIVEKQKQNGIRQIIEILHPGEFLGLFSGSNTNMIYKYACIAQTQSQLMSIG